MTNCEMSTFYEVDIFFEKVKKNLVVSFFCCIFVPRKENDYDKGTDY